MTIREAGGLKDMVSHHNTISGARAKACRAEIKTARLI